MRRAQARNYPTVFFRARIEDLRGIEREREEGVEGEMKKNFPLRETGGAVNAREEKTRKLIVEARRLRRYGRGATGRPNRPRVAKQPFNLNSIIRPSPSLPLRENASGIDTRKSEYSGRGARAARRRGRRISPADSAAAKLAQTHYTLGGRLVLARALAREGGGSLKSTHGRL